MFDARNTDLLESETVGELDPWTRVFDMDNTEYAQLVREWTEKIKAGASKRLRAEIDGGGW